MSNEDEKEYKIFSTFTGAGGLDIGFHGDFDFLGEHFKKLNFKTSVAMDLNKDACDTVEKDEKYFKGTKSVCTDIIESDPKDYDGEYDVLLGGFPCFLADTKIYTSKGYKKITDISVGDLVITHKNRFRRVTHRMEDKKDEIFDIKAQGSNLIKTTGNHPFYVITKDNEIPVWIEAKDLNKDHYLAYPKNNESKIPTVDQDKWISDYINTKDFWMLMGIYIHGGIITNYDKRSQPPKFSRTVIIRCRQKQTKEFDRITKLFDLNIRSDAKKSYTDYFFNDEDLFSFLVEYRGSKENQNITRNILDLPKDLLLSFLDGLSGGQCSIGDQSKKIVLTVKNEYIAFGVQQIVHKLYGSICSISRIKGKDQYRVSFGSTKSSTKIKASEEDDYIWTPLTKVTIRKEPELVSVYNLEVEDDHSYTANNIVVHNCVTFSIVGNRTGIKDDVKGKLYESYVRFVEALRPKVFLAENVKGILSANKGEAIKVITKRFEDTGYKLKVKLINFADFGVPQLRERVLFIGVRDDIEEEFNWPEPTHLKNHITSGQALSNISDDLSNNNEMNHPQKTINMLKAIPEGGNFKDLPKELSIKAMMSNIYRKLDRNKPSYTVIASGGGGTWHYHYEHPRALTNRERARIQSFPDDLFFSGTNTEVRRQIGNAVPPVGVYLFAKEIERILDTL